MAGQCDVGFCSFPCSGYLDNNSSTSACASGQILCTSYDNETCTACRRCLISSSRSIVWKVSEQIVKISLPEQNFINSYIWSKSKWCLLIWAIYINFVKDELT